MNKEYIYFLRRTLTHINMVQRNVLKLLKNTEFVSKYLLKENVIYKNVLKHDKSKFSEPQLTPYIDIAWFYKTGKDEYYDKIKTIKATILHITSRTTPS